MKVMSRYRKIATVSAMNKAEALEALEILKGYIMENYGDGGKVFEQVVVTTDEDEN